MSDTSDLIETNHVRADRLGQLGPMTSRDADWMGRGLCLWLTGPLVKGMDNRLTFSPGSERCQNSATSGSYYQWCDDHNRVYERFAS